MTSSENNTENSSEGRREGEGKEAREIVTKRIEIAY
jgi:hypothetical protein